MRQLRSKGRILVARLASKSLSEYSTIRGHHGAYYSNGYRIETNGCVGSIVQEKYAPEYEGNVVKDGEIVNGINQNVRLQLDQIKIADKILFNKSIDVDRLIQEYLTDITLAYSVSKRSAKLFSVVEFEGYLVPLETAMLFSVVEFEGYLVPLETAMLVLMELKKRGFNGECSLLAFGHEASDDFTQPATFFIQSDRDAVLFFVPSIRDGDDYLEFEPGSYSFVGRNGFSEEIVDKVNEMYNDYYKQLWVQ